MNNTTRRAAISLVAQNLRKNLANQSIKNNFVKVVEVGPRDGLQN